MNHYTTSDIQRFKLRTRMILVDEKKQDVVSRDVVEEAVSLLPELNQPDVLFGMSNRLVK